MDSASQDKRYLAVAAEYGPALRRLVRACEADATERRDLLQDIHIALWRSMAGFDGRCSMCTWVYRVAHNVAASHVRARQRTLKAISIEELEFADDGAGLEHVVGEQQALERLRAMIRTLKETDRHVMLLYLEGLDAAAIGEITGLSGGAVANKIHRIKTLLARRIQEAGGQHD